MSRKRAALGGSSSEEDYEPRGKKVKVDELLPEPSRVTPSCFLMLMKIRHQLQQNLTELDLSRNPARQATRGSGALAFFRG
jgi:hypothetical protein